MRCHPQYVKANFDVYEEEYASDGDPATDGGGRRAHAVEVGGAGHRDHACARRSRAVPDPDRDLWYAADRTVLAEGFDTESMDGQRVAPLMGDYQRRRRRRAADAQHAQLLGARELRSRGRRAPAAGRSAQDARCAATGSSTRTRAEGEDYQLERLLPFWHLTNEQDWDICKWQQKGVDSIGYEPGPLSQRKEYNVDAFIRWYLQQMRACGPSGNAARPSSLGADR